MKYNILVKLIFVVIGVFIYSNTFAVNISLENVFSDIDSNYEYYNELQTLYNKGVVKPDSDGKFNPGKSVSKDEFIGMITESSCTKCIAPNTSYSLLDKYSEGNIFSDINKNNKYYYCVADANSRGLLNRLNSTGCATQGANNFCPNENILLEDALEIALKSSGIMSEQDANLIREQILNGEIKSNLSDDMGIIDNNTFVYHYYPYFKKALEYDLYEYDSYGNSKRYSFVYMSENKLNPKKVLTKEDALRMTFTTLKASSCIDKDESSLGLQISIFPSTCNSEIVATCRQSSLSGNTKIYDFYANVSVPTFDNIGSEEQYQWSIYDYSTGTIKTLVGQYINDYNFAENGKYRVSLRVVSDRGKIAEVYNELSIGSKEIDKSVSIFANRLFGFNTLQVVFEGIVYGGSDKKTYYWNFGDGDEGYGKNAEHFYKQPGTYKVSLSVIDEDNNIDTATLYINVSSSRENEQEYYVGPPTPGDRDGDGIKDINDLCPDMPGPASNNGCPIGYDYYADYDGDGVRDAEDLCPTVPGPASNKGCPILTKSCQSDADCGTNEYCLFGGCTPKQSVINCNYGGGDLIIGNLTCTTCPCDYSIDFSSSIKKCDIIFPAILSPDGTEIYSQGSYYQVP